MNIVLKEAVCVLIILYSHNLTIHAQINTPKIQFGAGAGAFIYQGDLAPSSLGSYKTIKPVINLFAAKFGVVYRLGKKNSWDCPDVRY